MTPTASCRRSPQGRDSTVTIDKGDLVVRQDHPLASHHGPLTRKALAGLRWACSPVGTVCHLWFQRAVAGVDDHPEITHSSDDFSTQLALVDADNVVALIPGWPGRPCPIPW